MKEEEKKLEEVYFYWMERAMKAQRKAKNQLFKSLGLKLTSDQWIILKKLSEGEGLNQRELAESIHKDPASLTRIIDLLEKEGLVNRLKQDRRSFRVKLTKDGTTLVSNVLPQAAVLREKGIKGVSEEELLIFRKVLDSIYQNFSIEEDD